MRQSITTTAIASAQDTPPTENQSRSDIGRPLAILYDARGSERFDTLASGAGRREIALECRARLDPSHLSCTAANGEVWPSTRRLASARRAAGTKAGRSGFITRRDDPMPDPREPTPTIPPAQDPLRDPVPPPMSDPPATPYRDPVVPPAPGPGESPVRDPQPPPFQDPPQRT